MISILILTLNEEANLPACLEAVKWSDDVVVFDSFSSDRTVEIARESGARVFQRKFDNERDQRAASLKIEFKYPWVYNPDADEITPPELRDEMLSIVSNPDLKEVSYRLRFKTMFMGRWIKHCSLYPVWVVRLYRPEKIHFKRTVNLHYLSDGPEGRLKNHFIHYTFNNGLAAWFDKHNRYSSAEANDNLSELQQPLCWSKMFSSNWVERRRFFRELSFRLPFRSTLRFLFMYVLRLGFLDGWAGLRYCQLLATYEFMIVMKFEELKLRQQGRRL